MGFARSMLFTVPACCLSLVGLVALPQVSVAQTYNGDGATNGGAGTWITSSATSNQCLKCHAPGGPGADKTSYLMTGHKNMLRKVTAGKPWTFADGTPLRTTDTPAAGSLYNSGSTFDWTAGKITVGTGPLLPYPPDPYAGSQQDIFYIFGGWIDPSQLDTIWRGGFTGEQFASGNYECARCHTTGYRFDDTGVEPTFNGSKISGAVFSRVPTDYDPATGPAASWMLDGVQCERCHTSSGHTVAGDPALVTNPISEAATLLCLQCHREENVDTVNHQFTFGACSDGNSPDNATCVANGGNWVTDLVVYDGGSCSDGTSPDYGTCTAIPGNAWSYAPFFDHESGPTFLNSPHARFSGTLALVSQNSPDMSLTLTGAYTSAFQASGQNGGCTACHDPHQSLIPAVMAPKPFVKQCLDCHSGYANLIAITNHPNGASTPFDTGGDLNASCAVCHMSQNYHLFRINTDAGYSTFPTAAQVFAGGGQGLPNSTSDGYLSNAVWSDVDLACGQCHQGSGLLGPAKPGVYALDKSFLAQKARCMHQQPVIHTHQVGSGTISPPGTLFVASGGSQTLNFTPGPGYDVGSITVNGQVIQGPLSTYNLTNVTNCKAIDVNFIPHPVIKSIVFTGAGAITDSLDSQVVTGSGSTAVPLGQSVTFSFTPAPNWALADVVVNGNHLGAVSNYTFTNVLASQWVQVSFKQILYTITATAGPNGAIRPTGAIQLMQGSSQSLTLAPNAGYQIATLAIDGGAPQAYSGTSYTFSNVQANHSIAVTFAANAAASITASIDPFNSNGSIAPAPGTLNLLSGQSQQYVFTPNAGYQVGTVLVDGAPVAVTNSYTFSNITPGAHSLRVGFVPNSVTIRAVVFSGAGSITDSLDSQVITGSGTTTVPFGGNVTYSFNPALHWTVSDVNVNGSHLGAVPSYTFTNAQVNQWIQVNFKQILYTITATAGPNGAIRPTGAIQVVQGSSQSLTLAPNAGYHVATLAIDGGAPQVFSGTSYTFGNIQGSHSIAVTFAPNP
jgi:predicted CXXCH cytochrome family protein